MFNVAAAYVVVAWVLLQVAATLFPIYNAPDWVLKSFATLLFLGFPVAIVLAWAYELTAGGVIRTENEKADGIGSQAITAPAPETGPVASIELPSGPSIAVLPFRNLSDEPQQDLFAESLGGDIITGLTQSTHLFVLTAGATAGISESEPDINVIGKALGVSYLLQGSVRKSGETLRVSARLMDVSNGVQIWSQNYDKQLSAERLFEVQDDIREQIVATLSDLHGVIYSRQSAKNIHRPTHSLNAYECLSVALAYDKFLSEEYHLRARESLERAIEIDPEFDEAWSHLSWIYTDEFVFAFNPLPDSMDRALNAAQQAIKLAPLNYHNHWLLSRVHYFMGERRQFLAETQRALELNSNDGTTLGLIGMYTAWAGEWDRGMEMMDKAKLLNPNFPDYYHVAAGIAEFAFENFDDALQEFHSANLPEWPFLQIFMAATCGILNRTEEATRHLNKLEKLLAGLNRSKASEFLAVVFPFQPKLADSILQGLEAAGMAGSSKPETSTIIGE